MNNVIESQILKKNNSLTKAQNMKLIKFIDMLNIKIIEHADGSRINLSIIPKKKLQLILDFCNELT